MCRQRQYSVAIIVFVLWTLGLNLCHGELLNSYQHVIGDWNVTIQCCTREARNVLFPPTNATASSTLATTRGVSKARGNRKYNPWVGLLKRDKQLPCHMSIFSNGTFALEPHNSGMQTNGKSQPIAPQERLSMHGKWNIRSNPYCVTDRFYDELQLVSYPRVQVHAKSKKILQEISIQMDCRVWGRYSMPIKSVFQNQEENNDTNQGVNTRGRITHGTLSWDARNEGSSTLDATKQNAQAPWWRPVRRIHGTFRAKTT